MGEETTALRKDSHLDVCAVGEVEPSENRTLLECVHLLHCALPELSVADVDLSVPLLGKRLRYPLLITGMTGGTERAQAINRDLALLAEEHGLGFGVGSQRAMSEDTSRQNTYTVRDVAPSVLLLGNIGFVQAKALGVDRVRRLVDVIQADGLAVHLNAAQELTQPEGDRDFRGALSTIGALAHAFGDRLLVKETGCGIAPAVAARLVDVGVRAIDLSGLGGTSWVKVEQLRSEGTLAEVGKQFSGWGIPTAALVSSVRQEVGPGVRLVASGGIRHGLDVAKVLALGADVAGMALPFFRAQQAGGLAALERELDVVLTGLKNAFVLAGAGTVSHLRAQPRVVTGALKDWLGALEGKGRTDD